MTVWAITIEVPSVGATEDANAERDNELNNLVSFAQSLLQRQATRAGNVKKFDVLHSTGFVATEPTKYLLLLTVDYGARAKLAELAEEVSGVVPAGSEVSAAEFVSSETSRSSVG